MRVCTGNLHSGACCHFDNVIDVVIMSTTTYRESTFPVRVVTLAMSFTSSYRSNDAASMQYGLKRKAHPPGGRDSHYSRYNTDDRGTA